MLMFATPWGPPNSIEIYLRVCFMRKNVGGKGSRDLSQLQKEWCIKNFIYYKLLFHSSTYPISEGACVHMHTLLCAHILEMSEHDLNTIKWSRNAGFCMWKWVREREQCFPNGGSGHTSGLQADFWWVAKSFGSIGDKICFKKTLHAPCPGCWK